MPIPSLTLPRALEILSADHGEHPDTVLAAWRFCVHAADLWNIPIKLETTRDLEDLRTWVDQHPTAARTAAQAYADSHLGV